MINLSLNFKTETVFPNNSYDFEQIINTHEFQAGFKIVGSKIIALSSYNNEKCINKNAIALIYNNINDLFLKLQDNSVKKSFYVLKRDNGYTLHIDNDINEGIVDISVYNNTSFFKNKILSKIFGEVIYDPYIDKIVENYIETQLGFKNKIAHILKIVNKNDYLDVSFDSFLEENGGNPDDIDYYITGGGFITKRIKIKKEDLI